MKQIESRQHPGSGSTALLAGVLKTKEPNAIIETLREHSGLKTKTNCMAPAGNGPEVQRQRNFGSKSMGRDMTWNQSLKSAGMALLEDKGDLSPAGSLQQRRVVGNDKTSTRHHSPSGI